MQNSVLGGLGKTFPSDLKKDHLLFYLSEKMPRTAGPGACKVYSVLMSFKTLKLHSLYRGTVLLYPPMTFYIEILDP